MARPNLGRLLANKAKENSFTSKLVTKIPARTRFAPSPTGFVHLGSLRTALYNYLLARATKGQFILRLEDTDRTRLKPGAEENIYKSLEWSKILWDEGPIKQSERKLIYSQYAQELLGKGHAYRCFCSKERLDGLAESARQLMPPSTASYDRKCSHIKEDESNDRAQNGEPHVIRFKAPPKWPIFDDLLHGSVEAATQINPTDQRYDDFVILKSDGMPTYHFANVVDDSLMKITHVIRGEEWLSSTPKHISLYEALNKKPPHFVHIPLLTGAGGKKLSKRKSDQGVFDFANSPDFIGPEALVNFVALLGWSPVTNHRANIGESVSEVKDMTELEQEFSLEGLTKGNIQVDFGKLHFLNKQHFERLIKSDFEEAARRCHAAYPEFSFEKSRATLNILKSHVSCVGDYVNHITTVFKKPEHKQPPKDREILKKAVNSLLTAAQSETWDPKRLIENVISEHSKKANPALRYALLDGQPGTSIVEALAILGSEESIRRLNDCAQKWC